ncbi:MAG: hypothetical protein M1308_14040 [Actinobacteria bacterium]|nr:hypothetical protein [Actinomycetota bacterium]
MQKGEVKVPTAEEQKVMYKLFCDLQVQLAPLREEFFQRSQQDPKAMRTFEHTKLEAHSKALENELSASFTIDLRSQLNEMIADENNVSGDVIQDNQATPVSV